MPVDKLDRWLSGIKPAVAPVTSTPSHGFDTLPATVRSRSKCRTLMGPTSQRGWTRLAARSTCAAYLGWRKAFAGCSSLSSDVLLNSEQGGARGRSPLPDLRLFSL